MDFTSAPYGGNFTQATDLEVNTEVDEVYFIPSQLPFLTQIPYAGYTFFETNSDRTAIDYNGSSSITSGSPSTVDFTFTTALASTNYVIKSSNAYMNCIVTAKTTAGFSVTYTGIGSTAVMVFLEGYV